MTEEKAVEPEKKPKERKTKVSLKFEALVKQIMAENAESLKELAKH